MKTEVKLKIADIIIRIQSDFALEQLTEEEQRLRVPERFKNFFYTRRKKPDIEIKVKVVDKLSRIHNAKPLFITHHFQDGSENWRLLKKDNTYIYKSPIEDKRQLMLINEAFDRVTAFLLPKKGKGRAWNITDIIYDFLQVLLINYFAQRDLGIFTHSVGIKDLDGEGLLFTGKSGCGKSTTARIWHKYSKAVVLNDDRIVVRRLNHKFFIHGSPWHGEFSDYLVSRIESAALKRLFFIYQAPHNTVRQISQKGAFNLLYPALFPTFWDKACLENIASFCQDLVKNVDCFSLGFVNDKKMIGFVRNICERINTKPLV